MRRLRPGRSRDVVEGEPASDLYRVDRYIRFCRTRVIDGCRTLEGCADPLHWTLYLTVAPRRSTACMTVAGTAAVAVWVVLGLAKSDGAGAT